MQISFKVLKFKDLDLINRSLNFQTLNLHETMKRFGLF